jgi:predicted Fe-Mo cluster-binding NifX family protein
MQQMRHIRIALGSNDGVSVADTHMGDTSCFHVYDLFEDARSEPVDKRDNPALDGGHGKVEKMKAIVAMLKDVDVVVARKLSPNFHRIAEGTRHQPVVVDADGIDDALEKLHAAFDTISELTERREDGERFDTIPEL